MHQQVALGAGRRHQCVALTPLTRSLQKLTPHVPAAGLAQRRQQDTNAGTGVCVCALLLFFIFIYTLIGNWACDDLKCLNSLYSTILLLTFSFFIFIIIHFKYIFFKIALIFSLCNVGTTQLIRNSVPFCYAVFSECNNENNLTLKQSGK